jgi:hypothetical protein
VLAALAGRAEYQLCVLKDGSSIRGGAMRYQMLRGAIPGAIIPDCASEADNVVPAVYLDE